MFDEKTINAIKDLMVAHGQTISVAESVTSGLLQSAFASAQDASLFFQGGISAYNVGQKARHLNVEPIHAISNNCVSEKVAEEMALHVCLMFHSDWGISVTGYAAPVPQSNNELFAYYAICYKNKILKKGKIKTKDKHPLDVKLVYINEIIDGLYSIIKLQST